MSGDDASPLEGLRFQPRASLGPEIAGRARRGEVAKGGPPSRHVRPARRLVTVAALLAAVSAAGLAVRAAMPGTLRTDHCCQDLDGGADADDGFVVEARGRRIDRVTLYEDTDGDGRFSAADRVRLVRGRTPSLADDSVHASIRVCCADLDGEGAADDGLLVLHGRDERVLLTGVFEREPGTRSLR